MKIVAIALITTLFSTFTSSGQQVPVWGQCGGIGYTGPTQCVAGTTCVVVNDYYHQCQPV